MGCSPIKAVRELGSERRETVRSLSGVGVGYLRGVALSTRTGVDWLLVYLLYYQVHSRASREGINAEGI